MRRYLYILCGLACLASAGSKAFVFYLVADDVMRWNLTNVTRYHTNVVNHTTKKIRYFVASDLYSETNKTAELNAIRAAIDQWQSVPGAKIAFEEAGFVAPGVEIIFDNRNVIFWAKNTSTIGYANVAGRRGYTQVVYSGDDGRILEADIVLNGVQEKWFTDFNNKTNVAAFVEIVLLHELGHFLGLDHTPAGGGTVATGAPGISTELGLSADEIAAARFLYPDPALKWASVKGKVTMNGSGIQGAIVAIEDIKGNIAGATVTRYTGDYELHSLSAGTYRLRVSPLDPAGASQALLRPEDIGVGYELSTTAFRPNPPLTIALTNGQSLVMTNIPVASGNPPFRITGLTQPTTLPDLVFNGRYAVSLAPGQSGYYLSVNGAQLVDKSTLWVTGDGITVGTTVFKPNRLPGLHTLTVPISVSSNATPGLRTIVVQNGLNYAYAHGYFEVSPLVPDYNFDGLDDLFQRKYWPSRWTTNTAAPAADPDGDRFSNGFEYRTGTNPTNAVSFHFEVDTVTVEATGATVRWQADPGKAYQVYGREAFKPEAPWALVGAPVTATNHVASVFDSAPRGRLPVEKFYRVVLLP